MSSGDLLLLTAIPSLICMIVDLIMPNIQTRTGISSSRVFLTCHLGAIGFALWGMLGIFDLPFGGLKTRAEVSYARCCYGNRTVVLPICLISELRGMVDPRSMNELCSSNLRKPHPTRAFHLPLELV